MAFLILLGIQICCDEYFENGSFIPDTDMFFWVFSNFRTVLMMEGILAFAHLFIVPLVQIVHKFNLSKWQYIPLYSLLQVIVYTIGISACYIHQFPPASAMIVSCEMVRMSMKMHAYMREKMIYGRNNEKGDKQT